MATGTYVQAGANIDYTPGGAVAAGDIVVQNKLFGVAPKAIAANALGSLAIEGVFDLPKEVNTGTALTVGTKVWWDAGNSVVFTTESSNCRVGTVVKAAADADATVRVKLIQG
jgi:predicted RecA/RadA family phage recombinase